MQNFIKILFFILLFFLPLSFAGTESWSFFVFQSAITLIFCYLLLSTKYFCFSKVSKLIIYIFLILIIFGILQSFNQQTILDKVTLKPFSLCPFYTIREVSYLFTFLIVFFITLQLFQSYKQVKNLMLMILVSSGIVMLLCLFYPKGEYIKFFLGKNIYGAFGSFVNRNSAGAFLSLSFFVSLSFLLSNIITYIREHKEKTEYIVKISAQCILSVLFLFGVIFVRSRGAMLATYLSIFFLLLLSSLFFTHDKKKKLIYVLATISLFIVSAFLIYNNIDAINTYAKRQTYGISEQTRYMMYMGAFDMLKQYSFTGVGLAAFPVAINKFLEKQLASWPQNLHNDWLELILGIGYPLSVLIFLLMGFVFVFLLLRIKNMDRAKRITFICLGSGILAFCLASSVDFHFHIPSNAFLFFIVLAMVSAITFNKENSKTIHIKMYAKIPFICLAFIMLYFSFSQAVAWRYVVFGKNLMLEHKISYYEKALKYSKEPKYMQKLIITYYNTFFNKKLDTVQKQQYRQKANMMAEQYLELYPFDRQISKVYRYTSRK